MLETPVFGFWGAVWQQRGCIYAACRGRVRNPPVMCRQGLSPKPITNETNRSMYVESERESNPAIGWFFRCVGRGCRHARHRGCNKYDRKSEFPESAGRAAPFRGFRDVV